MARGKRIFDRTQAGNDPRWRVQDIDTQDDWERAEILAPIIIGVKVKYGRTSHRLPH